jgi:hypothetical protein
MNIASVQLHRFSVVSGNPFEAVLETLCVMVGHPDRKAFHDALARAKSLDELRAVVGDAVGPSDLMEFGRFDQGAVLRKEPASAARKVLRLLIGNPLIMRELVTRVPDAGSYAPVTVLIDERDDGVHLSYDLMTSLLAHSGDARAIAIACELDEKIQRLLLLAAGSHACASHEPVACLAAAAFNTH